MEEIEKHIINKLEECINNENPFILYEQPDKCNLFLPKIAIDNLINHFNENISKPNFNKFKIGNTLKYRGINVLLGYELAIVLAHEDCYLHPESNLIYKVNL